MKDKKRKPEERAEVSSYNPVPLYRSYGSTKKERKWVEEINAFIPKIITALILLGVFSIVGIVLYASFRFGSILLPTVFAITVFTIVFTAYTKTLRKRLSLNRKLKKLCKEYNFDLRFERSTIESLRWSESRSDITIVTKNSVFYVHLLAVPKYRCRIYLDSERDIRIIKPPLNNKFTTIFDFKPKVKKIALDFSDAIPLGDKKVRKILLVNPVCEEMHYRASKISTAQTGNGGEHFGYQVFTASGFINYLKRIDEVILEASKTLH